MHIKNKEPTPIAKNPLGEKKDAPAGNTA